MPRLMVKLSLPILAALMVMLMTPSASAVPGKRECIRADKEKENEEDEKIALKDLPKAVTDAVNAAVPGGTLKEAEKETKNGKLIYEVKTSVDKTTYEVKVGADGKVLSKKVDDDDEDDDDDDGKEGKKPVTPPAPPKQNSK